MTSSTSFRSLVLTLILLALTTPRILHAQYDGSVFDLKQAQDLYDERGFSEASAIDVDGKLDVAAANGNVSYSYPIAQSEFGGRPFKVSLNYCGSVQFTTFGQYNLAHSSSGSPSIYNGWERFEIERPAWIIGLNGFALNVIATTAGSYRPDASSSVVSSTMQTTFTDDDFTWLIDGYDFCNRMRDVSAAGSGTGDIVDVIKILKDDGSVMSLYNFQERPVGGHDNADTAAHLYTGYYHSLSANDAGFAVVEFDTNVWEPSVEAQVANLTPASVLLRRPLMPRLMSYYPGDGLRYIFRERVAPYGTDSYFRATANGEHTGGLYGHPTIFYLEAVMSASDSLVRCARTRHYPYYIIDNRGSSGFFTIPQPTQHDDTTRGRALITDVGGLVRFSIGDASMTIEALGRTTKVYYLTQKRCGPGQGSWGTYMPLGELGHMTPTTKMFAGEGDDFPLLHASFVGYVTKIVDPENRETNFDYEQYTREYTNFNFPQSASGTTIRLKNYRLKHVIEPTAKYTLHYRHDTTTQTVNHSSLTDHAQLNNVVDTMWKHTLSGTGLTKTIYTYVRNFSNPSEPTYTDVIQYDYVTGHSKMTETHFSSLGIPTPNSILIPSSRHTVVTSVTEYADSLETEQRMSYAAGSSLSISPLGSPYQILQTDLKVYRNSRAVKDERYEYTMDTVWSYGGNDTLAGKYGMGVVAKVTTHHRADNGQLRFTDTVNYRYLDLVDTTLIFTHIEWDKFATLANYFYYRDVLQDPYVLSRRWEDVMKLPPIVVWGDTVHDTSQVIVGPVAGLETRVTRANTSGIILQGVRHCYEPDDWQHIAVGVPRTRVIRDTVIGRGGVALPPTEYRYGLWSPRPTQTFSPTGAEICTAIGQHLYYRDTSLSWIPGGPGYDSGWKKSNYNGVSEDTLYGGGYYNYLPVGERKYVRSTDSLGTISEDSITTSQQLDYFARTSKTMDANGWVSNYEYDKNGRLLMAWLPYDYPPNPHEEGFDTVQYPARFASEMYGMTEYWYWYDTLGCQALGTPPVRKFWTGTYVFGPPAADRTILRAANPVTILPECPCDTGGSSARRKDEERGLATTCTVDKPYQQWKPDSGVIGVLTIPKAASTPFGHVSSLDSAWVAVMVTDVQGSCVNLEVSVPQFGFSRTYVFNCSGAGGGNLPYRIVPVEEKGGRRSLQGNGLSVVPGGRLLQFDMTPIRDSLVAMATGQTLTVKFRVTTSGASVDMLGGIASEDLRPRLWLKGQVRGYSAGHDDYTLAYTHDDANLTTTVSAKTDDTSHSANRGGADFLRHAETNHFFGADYRLLQSESKIGKPSSPVRRDTVRHSYNGAGQQLSTIDVEGDTTLTILDAADRPIIGQNTDGTHTDRGNLVGDPMNFGITDQDFYGFCSVTYTRDEIGRVNAEYRDALDSVRRVVIDTAGLKLTTRYHYDTLGRVDTVVNPAGQLTVYMYDPFGRVKTKSHPDLGTLSYAYDQIGNVRFTQTEDQANHGRLTFNEYDDLNRLVLVGEAYFDNEGKRDTLYPPVPNGESGGSEGGGGIGSKTDQKDETGSEKRDERRHLATGGTRLTDQIDPTILHNGGLGPILTANATLWKHAERVVPQIIPITPTTWWKSLCALPPLMEFGETTLPDTPSIAHRWTRWTIATPPADTNQFENIAKYPHFPRMAIAYDTFPRREGAIWMGFPTWAKWDSLAPTGKVRNGRGREVAVAWRERHDQPYHFSVQSYDERGRVEALLRFTETIGFDAVYYRYNSRNQIVQVMTADPYHRHTVWYGTDWNGRPDSVWSVLERDSGLAPGASVSPAFSQQRFCGWAQRPDSAELVYAYRRSGAVDTLTYARIGVTVDYGYNRRKWLDSMVASRMGMPIFAEHLSYDSAGRIVQQVWQHGMAPAQQQTYHYDKAARLDSWRMLNDTVSYTYDAVGNRVDESEQKLFGFGNTEAVYTYSSGANQLLSHADGPPLASPQEITSYTYDANGSQTGRRKVQVAGSVMLHRDSMTWSYRGLSDRYWTLTTPEPQEEWQYRYNPMGERESKRLVRRGVIVDTNQTDSLLPWQYYLLGGSKEQRAVWNGRLHNQSLCGDTGRRVYFYPSEYLTYTGGSRAITTRPNGTREYAITDHLGSTRVMLDTWGNPVGTIDYEPSGAMLMPGGGPRKSWIDRQQDGESGLRNHGVRQYDEEIGRFVSVDPWFDALLSVSTYNYANNSPIIAKDWTGRVLQFDNSQIEDEFYEAIDYLERAGVNALNVVQRLKDSKTIYRVVPGHLGGNGIGHVGGTVLINWNSHGGMAWFGMNGTQLGGWNYRSPALGLWHELGHAYTGDFVYKPANPPYNTFDVSIDEELNGLARGDAYRNQSEYFMITQWDWDALQKTNEAQVVRPCWDCPKGTKYDFITDSPTSNVPSKVK